jgi:uncharacterized membrane protein (UPF0127 family)
MEVYNRTKGLRLSADARIARTFRERLIGLMFSRKRRDVVLASPRQSVESTTIHMSFMFYPIDVAWVDDSLLVVDVARRLPPSQIPNPFRLYRPRKPAKYVVELGAGNLGATEAGDLIEFRE